MTNRTRKLLITLGVLILIVGLIAWLLHPRTAEHTVDEVSGKRPLLVEADNEVIPGINLIKSIGWGADGKPQAAQGLEVTRFADGLDHPRIMHVLPNGDVLVVETGGPGGGPGGITGFIMKLAFMRVGAGAPSPNAIVLLRDSDGDGKAEQRFVLRQGNGLASPSGLAWRDGKLYVTNHDAVLSFDYALGETKLGGEPKKLMDLPPAGNHWMRNVVLSPDGKYLYIAVGSASNIGENGMEIERGRAAIWELNLETGSRRRYAEGLRNANGLAWNPSTGELWTTVNERDQLGPDLVPDYLTNVPVGAQYGWPWVYWKDQIDWRVNDPMPEFLHEYTRKPEYALGPHVAALGLAFVTGGERLGPNFANGAFIARHGSWNRTPPSGYDVVFVKFDANGNPQGLPQPVLTGFLAGKGETRGRPTWVAKAADGALLVTDDTAGIVWRVIAPGAAPAAEVKPVVTAHMPPRRQIDSATEASFSKDPAEE